MDEVKIFSVRLQPQDYKNLQILASLEKRTRGDVIRRLICQAVVDRFSAVKEEIGEAHNDGSG
jgi:predicted transcriptional regulator